MSAPFRRGKFWSVKVPTRSGGWVNRSTGSQNLAIATGMSRMLLELGPMDRRDWVLLDALRDNRLNIARLWDAFRVGEEELLKQELQDVDLSPLVNNWLRELADRVAPDTLAHYRKHVESLIVPNIRFPASRLKVPVIREWLADVPFGPSTRRKYHAALSSFAEYLLAGEIIPANPLRALRPPPAARPRARYLDHNEVLRLVEAMPGQFQALSAIIHATGIELSVAIGLERRDIDLENRRIHARGTKNLWRDRIVSVEEWAIPYFREYLQLLTPGAKVFPGVSRYTASDVHRRVCAELGISDYQFKDSRHTYAVRLIRAGTPPEMVAKQLGHVDSTMVVRIYGRFNPDLNDLRHWQDKAAEMDRTRGVG